MSHTVESGVKAAPKTARDPVCGMEFDEATGKFSTEYKDVRFYFCSFTCQSEFEKNPEKYSVIVAPLKVRDIITSEVETVGSDTSVLEAAKRMASKGRGCLLVIEKGKIIGIVTERDLVSKVLAEDVSPSKLRAKDVMSSVLVVVSPDVTIGRASEIMSRYQVRRLPVVEEGKLVGLITVTDIALQMAREKEFKDYRLNAVARYCVSPVDEPYG